jgi:hypothetical protein
MLFCHTIFKQDRSWEQILTLQDATSLTEIRLGTVRRAHTMLNRTMSDISPKHRLSFPARIRLQKYDVPQQAKTWRLSFRTLVLRPGGYILWDCSCRSNPVRSQGNEEVHPLTTSPWAKCKSSPLPCLRDLIRSTQSRECQIRLACNF